MCSGLFLMLFTVALFHILNSTEYQFTWSLSDGFQSGTGTLKNTLTYQLYNKKGRDQQNWTWTRSLFSRIPVNSVTSSRLGCSEGPTWRQETIMVLEPIIQHETSLWPLYHTCPLYWSLELPPESLFPQPFITFKSRTKNGISACALLLP